jgi:hypothetical protein
MSRSVELPMAVAGCGLDQAALTEQLTRYRRLGAGAAVTRRSPLELVVDFAAEPDRGLLDTTMQVERGCCSFFALDYDEAARRLTVAVADPERQGALDAIQAAVSTRAAV